jgi:hypothetical protein
MLFDGLRFVGYDETSLKQVMVKENVERFKSFYGVAPSSLVPVWKTYRMRIQRSDDDLQLFERRLFEAFHGTIMGP